jgi:selenocysteine lyase/cysteine desulfurase
MRKLSDQIEARPDLFMRRSYLPILEATRANVAKLIGAETDEVVIVPNATHGINTIVNNIKWAEGDIIVICTFPIVATMLIR